MNSDKKITYEQYMKNRKEGYIKPYCNKRYKKFNKGMDKNTRDILWTALWFMFIGGLCVLFNSAAPLWMLVLWFFGLYS